MTRFLLILLGISLLLNLFLWSRNQSYEVDRQPPWAPFTLNSNLTLESLIKYDYKFGSMPCGQVQFYKTIADTTIQYEVGIDCNSYDRTFEWLPKLNSESVSILEQTIEASDPYYPFDYNQIENCYQEIIWRVYCFKMTDPNRNEIINFIRTHGGRIVENTEKWNADGSGSLMVYNRRNALYFKCTISKETVVVKNKKNTYWEFKTISNIPILDTKRIKSNKERTKKRDQYYEEKMFVPSSER